MFSGKGGGVSGEIIYCRFIFENVFDFFLHSRNLAALDVNPAVEVQRQHFRTSKDIFWRA